MPEVPTASLGRRAFVASSLLVGCGLRTTTTHDAPAPPPAAARVEPSAPVASPAEIASEADASAPPIPPYALFDAYPALAQSIARIALGAYPSATEQASSLAPNGSLWIKRDDDFTRGGEANAGAFGGGKVRKLELLLGEARALGKSTLITSGGVGSNQAVALAVLGKALGFTVHLHLAPMASSSLVEDNLGADAASGATMRLFDTVYEAHAEALREAVSSRDVYVIPPGGTVPLGTLGFVNAGMELAADVRAGRMPAPNRVYVALGLGGTAAGLGIGCALGGLATEIVAVRASSPGGVTDATLRAIHEETIAFLQARAPVPRVAANVRIEGRFVGAGYGVPTAAGRAALSAARDEEGWQLDPVYTAKALAAALADHDGEDLRPRLFWNTMSSRPIARAEVPVSFRRFIR